jgi:hypothetical protein
VVGDVRVGNLVGEEVVDVAVEGGERAAGEGPLALAVVGQVGARVLQEGDEHERARNCHQPGASKAKERLISG